MIRPPPRSPLFPSPPLFRSEAHTTLAPRRGAPPGDGEQGERRRERAHPDEQRARAPTARVRDHRDIGACDRRVVLARRSEEHTSELQSLAYLVCRLLLAKKT